MSYAYRSARSLGSCDFGSPAVTGAPGYATDTPGLVKATTIAAPDGPPIDPSIAQDKAHAKSIEQQRAYGAGITAIQATWAALPVGPYPPATDQTGFPRTGDARLTLSKDSVAQAALLEPGRITAGMLAQAEARRPRLSPLFWVGLACLGAGIYVARR